MVARHMVGLACAWGAAAWIAFGIHAPAAAGQPAASLESDSPPPTPYDLHHDEQPMHLVAPDGRTLAQQVGRTVLALAFVVVLIYLFAKLALPRFYRGLQRGGSGQLKVVERLALDGKHAVVLLEVSEGPRLLVGTGDGGVQLLTELPTLATSFNARLQEARSTTNSSNAGGPDDGKRGGDAKAN